ncbi:hypothetical protein DFH09DRAFT_270554 [Mycena vulgaris]|nr:hypothetical protein DFH09DRAFT_270554 [Mycena vulgaris]
MTDSQHSFRVSESDLSELRHNILPDLAVSLALKDSILAAERRLANVAFSDISPVIDQEYHEISRYITLSSSRLAPVRRLPPELLSKIFGAVATDHPSVIIGITPPAPISAVSTYWRAVAASTPELWSDFGISLCGGDKALQTLDLHLSRAQHSNLTLRITAQEYIDNDTPVNPTIVTRLLHASERWITADMRLSHRLLPLFSLIHGRLSALKFLLLQLDLSSLHEDTNPLEDLDMFEIAPALHRVTLLGMKTILRLPRDIHEIHLDAQFQRDLSRIAINFPHLRRLSFDGSWNPRNPSTSTANHILHLPTLVSCGPVTLNTLHYLSFPDLVHLHIRSERVKWELRPFADFLTRSGCSLTSLTIQNILVHGNDLLALFSLIPAIETLSLVKLPPNALLDKVFRALILSPGASPLLPALTSLKLWGSYLFTNTALLEMLESRTSSAAGVTNLQRVEFMIGHREFLTGDVERLRALQSVKINLNLLNGTKMHIKVI